MVITCAKQLNLTFTMYIYIYNYGKSENHYPNSEKSSVWPMVSRQSSPLATDLSILRMGIGIYRDNVVKTMP